MELEARLTADADGAEAGRVIARLETGRRRAKELLDRGVPPEAYRNLMSLVAAYDAALSLVPELRSRLRRSERDMHG
jgi:hypothetical protein